jgi:hypothetical protein
MAEKTVIIWVHFNHRLSAGICIFIPFRKKNLHGAHARHWQ